MIRAFSKKMVLAVVLCAAAGLVLGSNPISSGQDKGKSESKEKAKGRLPAYYADVVNGAQRDKIYAIQEAHEKKIAALRDAVVAAEKARDTEIEAVLDAEQKVKVAAAKADAAAKKAKAAAEKKTGEGKGGDKK